MFKAARVCPALGVALLFVFGSVWGGRCRVTALLLALLLRRHQLGKSHPLSAGHLRRR